jgi:hypothetical protein
MTFTRCLAPAPGMFSGYVPRLNAVSPAGRIAVAATNDSLTVYSRHEAGGTCTYLPDPDYGNAGTIAFSTPYFEIKWDYQERLYVSAQLGFTVPQQPGSFYRVSPRGRTDSCKYNRTADARITDGMPDTMTILPNGEKAFLYWRGLSEDQLDLGDLGLGDGSEACNFARGISDVQHYTSALSVSPAGLLFLRQIDGVVRAVETDSELDELLVFAGGGASDSDGPGLAGFTYLSRCPHGYCAADDSWLKVFDSGGRLLHAGPIAGALRAQRFTTTFLTPAVDGGAWLRGIWYEGSGAGDDVVVHMASATAPSDGGATGAGGAAGDARQTGGDGPDVDGAAEPTATVPRCSVSSFDAGPAACNNLAAGGSWVAARTNADASSFPAPGGGEIAEGEYDLVAADSTKRAFLPMRRTLHVGSNGKQFDEVTESRAAAAEIDVVHSSGTIEASRNELALVQQCGGLETSHYRYVVDRGGFRAIQVNEDDRSDLVLYTYRQRCGSPVGVQAGDDLRPRVGDIAVALCSKIFDCCDGYTAFISGTDLSQAECVPIVTSSLTAQLSQLPASIAVGRSSLSSASLDGCLSALSAHACEPFTALIWPPPGFGIPFEPSYLALLQCPTLIVPNVDERGTCADDFECRAGRCRATGGAQQCMVMAAEGERCGGNGVACASGLFCGLLNQVCQAAAPVDGPCDPTYGRDERACQPGLYCKDGLGGGTDLICATAHPLGAACSQTDPVPCALGSFCCSPDTANGSCSDDQSCIPQFPDGHVCLEANNCISGHCALDGVGPGGHCAPEPARACP